jgi:hypothetical protein
MLGKFSFTDSLRGIDFYGPDPANEVSVSISGSVESTGTVIALGTSSLDGELTTSLSSLKISLGESSMDSTSVTLAAFIEILLSPEITISSSATLNFIGGIKFSPSLVEDTQSIRPLLVIDGIPISEHGRTFNESIFHSYVETKNWDARLRRYYRRTNGRKTFSISWTYLPGEREFTADLRFGRNKIKELAQDPDVHILKIRNIDTDGLTPYSEDEYNVLVISYTETLLRRDENQNVYFWDCSLELEEV